MNLVFDRETTFIAPGAQQSNSWAGAMRGASVRYENFWCNYRSLSVADQLAAGVHASAITATIILRWEALLDEVTNAWTVEVDGRAYAIIGGPQEMERRKYVRFSLAASGAVGTTS